jgi:hypothetical protein
VLDNFHNAFKSRNEYKIKTCNGLCAWLSKIYLQNSIDLVLLSSEIGLQTLVNLGMTEVSNI